MPETAISDTAIYAVSVVLLIGVAALGLWFLRQSLGFDGVPLFTPKQRRLGVIESTSVDGRRRLLLVRRDNVEHLIMTGGPVDVLIETGIAAPRPSIIGLEQPPAMASLNGLGSLNGHEPKLADKAPITVAASEPN
jgi:hypothetical protein